MTRSRGKTNGPEAMSPWRVSGAHLMPRMKKITRRQRPVDPNLIQLLRSIASFARLSGENLDALARSFQRREIQSNTPLFIQGHPGHTMYLVEMGLLRAERKLESGRSFVLGQIRPGELVGEMSVLDPAPRSATVTAATAAVRLGNVSL